MRAFVIGTCRVHKPARLIGEQFPAAYSGHRVHSPNQILQIVRHLAGEAVYDERTIRYLTASQNRGTPTESLARLNQARTAFCCANSVLLEVSSFREIILHEPVEFCADPLVAKLLPASAFLTIKRSPEYCLDVLRNIKEIIRRPILWVSHVRPTSPDPRFDVPKNRRQTVADTLKCAAVLFGDGFFDPTEIVEQLGQSVALNRKGEDLNHFSEAGLRALADRYAPLLKQMAERV